MYWALDNGLRDVQLRLFLLSQATSGLFNPWSILGREFCGLFNRAVLYVLCAVTVSCIMAVIFAGMVIGFC